MPGQSQEKPAKPPAGQSKKKPVKPPAGQSKKKPVKPPAGQSKKKPAKPKRYELHIADLSKATVDKILELTSCYSVRKYKSLYTSNDKEILEDEKTKFLDAIKNFKDSSKEAVSNNKLDKSNFSLKLQKQLEKNKNGRVTDKDNLFRSFKDEVCLIKIIPFEPKKRR